MDLTEVNKMDLTEVNKEIERIQIMKRNIRETLEGAQGKLGAVQKDIPRAEMEKTRVLNLFVTGSATQKDVDFVKIALKTLHEKENDLSDLLDASERALAEIKRDLPILLDRKAALLRKHWLDVFEQLRDQLRASCRDQVLKVLAAADLSGSVWNHPRFISELFFDGGTIVVDEVKPFKQDLETKYLDPAGRVS